MSFGATRTMQFRHQANKDDKLSIPLHSGYTFRTRAILEHQRAMGWETLHLTGTKQGSTEEAVEQVDGLTFHRTQPSMGGMTTPQGAVRQDWA